MTREEFLAGMAERAAEAERQIADCHHVVACPSCGAPVGHRCVRKGQDYMAAASLKRPHRRRWTLVVPAR